jgi:glycosyltransferase involved in cell wall biosynthesis
MDIDISNDVPMVLKPPKGSIKHMNDRRGEPLRIVLACPNFHIGGWSTHTLTLAEELKRVGHHVIALVLDPFGELHETFQEIFDEVVVLRRGLERRDTFLRRILGVLVALRPNAVLSSGVPAIQAIYPYLDRSIVRISTIHNVPEFEVREGCANGSSTDYVVSVARNIDDRARIISTCPTELIPVAVPIGPERDGQLTSNPLCLAYVGRLSKKVKNLGVLIDISDKLWTLGIDFLLTFIGVGEAQAELMSQLESRPFRSRIKFLGLLTPPQVRQRLLDMDVLLLSSTFEGTPHAVLEAMQAGVVPVMSRIPGATDDIIEHGVSGFLCDTNDSSQYVAALTKLHNDRQLLRRMSLAARAAAISRYSASSMAQRYLELIERALASNSFSRKKLVEATHIKCCPELRHICYGFARQVRRRAGDLYRDLAHGIRPCCLPTSTGGSKFS